MKKTALTLSLLMPVLASPGFATEQPLAAARMPTLDHVFVIMMENHIYGQIINNPNAPFTNAYAKSANLATNYFAVGHPSLTNYLEVVGGSNFGVRTDSYPDWHNSNCSPNLATGMPATDNPPTGIVCPIAGTGTDATTPAVDTTNETQVPPGLNDIDGTLSFPAAPTTGKTIADQLVAKKLTWKSYQESLPLTGADGVNYSDGEYSNLTDFSTITPALTPPLTQSDIVFLYAVKHNPFAYFKNVQEGSTKGLSLANSVGFDGPGGLFDDLGTGNLPSLSFIVPNQCDDQHGRGNGTAFCAFDPDDNGTQAGTNPGLIYRGDVAVATLVNSIHNSPVWKKGKNAIVLLWDENDYSIAPNVNQIVLIVDTNYGAHGVTSSQFYTHFSLLKTLEAGFKLPCLNHACDFSTALMTPLFGVK